MLYVLIAGGGDAGAGWGIPMATDIAFAVGVLGLLGRRIPSALRLFLLTLAIVDDIGAIIVIAVFYTASVELAWLALALGLLALMFALQKARVWSVPVYVVLGVRDVVRAARVGGARHPRGRRDRVDHARRRPCSTRTSPAATPAQALVDNHLDTDELSRLRFLLGESVPMVERLQSLLHPLSSYVVLPVFALANAGVDLGGIGEALSSPVALGIVVGLVLGKPIGILLASCIAVKVGLGRLPGPHDVADGARVPGAVAGVGLHRVAVHRGAVVPRLRRRSPTTPRSGSWSPRCSPRRSGCGPAAGHPRRRTGDRRGGGGGVG